MVIGILVVLSQYLLFTSAVVTLLLLRVGIVPAQAIFGMLATNKLDGLRSKVVRYLGLFPRRTTGPSIEAM